MSLSPRLPPELWCMAWETMSFADRVSVSHVSRIWRQLSIHCPRLWTQLDFFSSVHGMECDCDPCSHAYADPASLTKPPGATNRSLIVEVARRSGKLPLSLNMVVGPLCSDMNLLEDFAADLHDIGAADRLVSLRVVFDDQDALRCFLYNLRSLPVLRTIHTEALPVDFRRSLDAHAWHDNYIELPALQRMVLDCMCWKMKFNDEFIPVALPSLESLVCELDDPEEVSLALDACPALHTLAVRVRPYDEADTADDFDWRLDQDSHILRRLSQIRRIAVTGVTPASELWAVENFSRPWQRDTILHYDAIAPPLHGFTTLQQLGDLYALALSSTHNHDSFICSVVSQAGFRRRLVFSATHWRVSMRRILENVPFTASLQVLQLPAGLLTLFLSQGFTLSGLHTLGISVRRAGDLVRPGLNLSGAVPSLLTVRLSATEASLLVAVELVTSLLLCLRGGDFLKNLILEGVALEGDVTVLYTHVANIATL
ncbi:hypothetical protein EXIGLDRAFT_831279 [Exidia glandulosa HHB12029]|uniref:F-box domain-containing protein n=1 Tax=Exidia glandulosa HHB12029 TaxID=1314781 RepID=A0A165MTP0_EXIGL|nr:hypothetical protein EXIGLDRAFT_831279 [Exidia glandulosa HHB12029]